ncbi:alpha-L-rhamnosidase-related protein [Pedobacter helvus]|uniref:Alpha-L-rhamnosidase C-terminal domain-containing protein n=1 Tax=Pedobacter helvus TaxID=2563444 RepID=A0ABW9JPN5_9SPHI|nr:alpha-L-rhamnosidase C-terminal domain-containing protein [Pedobacter ureilyticus]
MKELILKVLAVALILTTSKLHAQEAPKAKTKSSARNEFVREYKSPVRVVWQSNGAEGTIKNTAQLLKEGNGQADLSSTALCVLESNAIEKPALLIDFGKEIHGGLQIVTGRWQNKKPIKVRVRFGESVSEAISDIGEKGGTNDHAMRDFIIELPWLGSIETGNTGFRFVRIDLLDENATLHLKEVRAISIYRDIPYLGSFKSSDERLNKIWQTGAYTVHLNMQEYLWDGIKRDRLVWVGDMHPEVATINAVFGYNEVVPKSLDLARDITPLPGWMNTISTYSMWWIILQKDWYMHNGDMAYLKQQQSYLQSLLRQMISKIDNNKEKLDGVRFLDWPSSEDKQAIHAGLQAMMVWSLSVGKELSILLKDEQTVKLCETALSELKKYVPTHNNSKQAAALMALSGLMSAESADKEVLSVGGTKNFSTFYGYYMLQAQAKARNYQGALNNIREFWGAMLNLGATTFWEDFNMEWKDNAARIDEIVPSGKKDVHGDYGAYCYVGHRHSLCHGWASGPTAWLTEHVLGIKVTAPGCKEITIKPNLADLEYAEGTFPTPFGKVWVKHTKKPDGSIETKVKAPQEVKIVKK